MKVIRTIQLSIWDLGTHAFRSMLTALGVVFGVGAVVSMMAVSEGARRESIRQIEARGIDNIVIKSQRPVKSNSSDQNSWGPVRYGLTKRNTDHLLITFDNVRMIVPVRRVRKPILHNGENTDINMFSTTPEFLKMSNSILVDGRGRFIRESDAEDLQKVCVVGIRASRKLFSYHDPIGKYISAGNSFYKVVGVFENPYGVKMLGGLDLDNQIFCHIKVAKMLHGIVATEKKAGSFERTVVEADFYFVRVKKTGDDIANTASRIRTYLKQARPQQDYVIDVPFELLKQREATQRIQTIVMASIAAISLLVGGIGIMNIMLANIYERTKEIGTRRAVGAKKRDILIQFVVEAVVLTSMGGLLGVAVGMGLAWAVSYYAGMQTFVTWLSVGVSFSVSVMVGVIFGTYPAWKAANLDPIDALRSE